MRKFLILFLIFNFVLNCAFSESAPESNKQKVSDISKLPCHVNQLNLTNIQQVKNSIVKHDDTIKIECAKDYFTFNSQNTFELKCDNGRFFHKDKNVSTEMLFCDKKCDITYLIREGFEDINKSSQVISESVQDTNNAIAKNYISPGQTITMKCPKGKTAQNGNLFHITCLKRGMINNKSPRCFDEKTACRSKEDFSPALKNKIHQSTKSGSEKTNDKKFDNGARLICQGKSGRLIISCNNSKWSLIDSNSEMHKSMCDKDCLKSCVEDLLSPDFHYINLQALVKQDQDKKMSYEELIDFCNEKDNLKECEQRKLLCKHDNTLYTLNQKLKLQCGPIKATFLCVLGSFVNITDPDQPGVVDDAEFDDKNITELMRFNSTRINIEDCEGSEVIK